MSSYKLVNGNYELTCQNFDASGTPTNLGTFTINANVVIVGSTTNTTPSVSTNPFITVAANNTGTVTDMGLLAQTGLGTFAGLRFDSTANVWQLSSSVDSLGAGTYANIATGAAAVAGNNTQIQFNDNGSFGGAANLTYTTVGNASYGNATVLALTGIEQFNQIGNAQGNVSFAANASLLFSNPAQSGGTGLYFISPNPGGSGGIEDELISKTKAIVYSIIF